MVMVSRNEIIAGVALLGIVLFSSRGGDPFKLSTFSFTRQKEFVPQGSMDPITVFDFTPSQKIERSGLIQERAGIIEGLNNLITPFFRRFFSFNILGNVEKEKGAKFRVAGGSKGIFGIKPARCPPGAKGGVGCTFDTSPGAQRKGATLKFGKDRITEINELLAGIKKSEFTL